MTRMIGADTYKGAELFFTVVNNGSGFQWGRYRPNRLNGPKSESNHLQGQTS